MYEQITDLAGEIITLAATLLFAWVKKKIDLHKLKKSGKLKD